MALAYANKEKHSFGSVNGWYCTINADNSYTTGGYSVDKKEFGAQQIKAIIPLDTPGGYDLGYDEVNQKLKFYDSAGAGSLTFNGGVFEAPLIVEEVVAVSANTGTLSEFPRYIVGMEVTAGSVTGAFAPIPNTETAATTECQVNFSNGSLTFNASDAVTSVRVTYFPQRPGSFFSTNNYIVNESQTAAAAGVNLANRAWAVQYVYDTTGNTLLTPIPVGETPGVGQVAIDIDNSGNTTITTNSGIDGNTLAITYQRHDRLPAPDMHIGDTDLTLSSEAYNFTSDGGYPFIVVPGLGVHVVGEETGAGNEVARWVGPSGTAANGVAVWQPSLNAITTNNSNAYVTLSMPWLVLATPLINEQTPSGTIAGGGGSASEVANATNLSALTGIPVLVLTK